MLEIEPPWKFSHACVKKPPKIEMLGRGQLARYCWRGQKIALCQLFVPQTEDFVEDVFKIFEKILTLDG